MSQQAFSYDSYHEYENEAIPGYGRIYVRSNVFLPSSELDPRTGMLKPDERPHGRTQALRMEDERLSREYELLKRDVAKRKAEKPGVRMSRRAAVVLCALTAFVLAMVWLTQYCELTNLQKQYNTTKAEVDSLADANANLKKELTVASDRSRICYLAATELGLVAPEDVRAIKLDPVNTRPKQNQTVTAAQANEASVDANPTHVPVLASVGE